MLDAPLLAKIEAWLTTHYPDEACGLIVRDHGTVRFIPTANVAPDRRRDFAIADEVLLRVELSGAEVLAIVHSHPDGVARLSAEDVERATYRTSSGRWPLRPGVAHVVAAVHAGVMTDVRVYEDTELTSTAGL